MYKYDIYISTFKYHIVLLQAGVHYIEGRATVKDEHTVHINGKDYTVSSPVFVCIADYHHEQNCSDAFTSLDSSACMYCYPYWIKAWLVSICSHIQSNLRLCATVKLGQVASGPHCCTLFWKGSLCCMLFGSRSVTNDFAHKAPKVCIHAGQEYSDRHRRPSNGASH